MIKTLLSIKIHDAFHNNLFSVRSSTPSSLFDAEFSSLSGSGAEEPENLLPKKVPDVLGLQVVATNVPREQTYISNSFFLHNVSKHIVFGSMNNTFFSNFSVSNKDELLKSVNKRIRNSTEWQIQSNALLGNTSATSNLTNITPQPKPKDRKAWKTCATMNKLLSQITSSTKNNGSKIQFVEQKISFKFHVNFSLTWKNLGLNLCHAHCRIFHIILMVFNSAFSHIPGIMRFDSSPNVNEEQNAVELSLITDFLVGSKNKSGQIVSQYITNVMPRLKVNKIYATEDFEIWSSNISMLKRFNIC